MTLATSLYIACAMFSLGVYGVLTHKNAIGLLLSIEVMANAGNLVLVAFSNQTGSVEGQLFAIFVMTLTVAEVVVGLSLVIMLYRAVGHTNLDEVQQTHGPA